MIWIVNVTIWYWIIVCSLLLLHSAYLLEAFCPLHICWGGCSSGGRAAHLRIRRSVVWSPAGTILSPQADASIWMCVKALKDRKKCSYECVNKACCIKGFQCSGSIYESVRVPSLKQPGTCRPVCKQKTTKSSTNQPTAGMKHHGVCSVLRLFCRPKCRLLR